MCYLLMSYGRCQSQRKRDQRESLTQHRAPFVEQSRRTSRECSAKEASACFFTPQDVPREKLLETLFYQYHRARGVC